jgi:hypothetical protein
MLLPLGVIAATFAALGAGIFLLAVDTIRSWTRPETSGADDLRSSAPKST